MAYADVGSSRERLPSLARLRELSNDSGVYLSLNPNQTSSSPAGSTGAPVFIAGTPQSDSPPPTSMSDSWVAVTPTSDDEQPRPHKSLPVTMIPDLALVVEGLRIHEHEESFPSEGEDEDEDISLPLSEDSSGEEDDEDDEVNESSDEETVLAPRTLASLGQPLSDEALRASLSTLLKSKEVPAALLEEFPSPRRMAQGPMGMESLSLLTPEEFATRTSVTNSRASSSKSRSRTNKKSHSKRTPRTPSKARNKDNGAQVYAIWTAAITAGFLVGFGAGYAWKEYLAGGSGTEEVRRVGCAWCGDGKR